ncbi:MAG: DUF349 domain-containing protein [Bacteroidota bacterium]
MDKERELSEEVDNSKNQPETNAEVGDSQVEQKEEAKLEAEESAVNDSTEVSEEAVPQDKQEVTPPEESTVQTDDTPSKEPSKEDKKEINSEDDLNEVHEDHHEEEEHHHEEEEIDFSDYDKSALVKAIEGLGEENDFQKINRTLKALKHVFDELKDQERAEALKKFIDDGGEEDDFEYKYDELTNKFEANYKLLKDRFGDFQREKERQKERNLEKKEELLERLRAFVDSDDTNVSFNTFKEMQDEWKSIGPVPGAFSRTLWANYNALVNRFYDHRSIYFELKELDRKKNLESKIELCGKAEKLSEIESIKDAIKELNQLHHDFKHIGPVPKEEQEPLWQRFKAASDAVYKRRKEFLDELKDELEENFVKKTTLAEEVQAFTQFDSDRIKEWNEKTKEILEVQKRWEAIGGLPKDKAKGLNKHFWSAFKTFFNNKGGFFKKLDEQREQNLNTKKGLVEKAEALKESDDWDKTANELKQLQKDWREIGPVPEKYRNEIYKQFKDACDEFFNRKREANKESEGEYEENLKRKQAICAQIEQLTEEGSNDVDLFKSLQTAFYDIGFVPKRDINVIKSKFAEAVEGFIEGIEGMSEDERQRLKLENQINRLRHSPNSNQKLYKKEQALRKQISKVENDIAVWRNNMEFFSESKTASKLKSDFEEKIEAAQDELKSLKEQLKLLRMA